MVASGLGREITTQIMPLFPTLVVLLIFTQDNGNNKPDVNHDGTPCKLIRFEGKLNNGKIMKLSGLKKILRTYRRKRKFRYHHLRYFKLGGKN